VEALGCLVSGRISFGRSYTRLVAFTVCILLAATFAQARVHRSQAWAETQFAKAEAQRETLNGRAEQARTRRQYETVIASYRLIVLDAPTSSKAEGSAFAVAELTAEMGRHFKDDMALYAAVREYKFLRREYPGSKHRIEALLAIGEIYKNDLGDAADARMAFGELIRRYPHSELVKEAKAELAAGAPEEADNKDASSDPDDTQAADASAKTERVDSPADVDSATARRATKQPATVSSDKTIRVKDVQYWSTPEYTRIAIDLEQDVQFESQRLDSPDRIFFDLKNAQLASHLMGQSFDVDDGLVKKVRVAQYKPGRARVVVETENHVSYNAALVLNPPRLVIDVHGDETHAQFPACTGEDARISTVRDSGGTEPALSDRRNGGSRMGVPARTGSNSSCEPGRGTKTSVEVVTPPPPSREKPVLSSAPKKVIVEADSDDDDNSTPDIADASATNPAAKTAKGVAPVQISGSSRSRGLRSASTKTMREAQPTSDGDRSLIRALGLKIGKIVIDPGHGGHDTGTIGPNGLLEKDLVLDVSKRLAKLLESRLGAEVVFTRRDDTFIPLETRTSIANQEQADLFVSVHANSSHDPDARGVETYYLNFTSSPEALEVAARENAASDKSIHELQDLVKTIALKEKIEESREFASDVQQSLHTGLAAKSSGVRDRGVKKAPFVVLIGANMPSILAEISFLSNPGDEKRLKTPDYRQRIAESLYRGISRYVNGLGGVKVASRLEKASAN
jgi:N-acetylmuramoyl-L-alanine amidase